MKHILILLFIFTGCMAAAQDQPAVTGTYRMGSNGDPQGGATLFILENHRYAVVFFGGAQIGTWKITGTDHVDFTPATQKQPFKLYGRHNKDLGDSIRVFFNSFSDRETFVHFGQLNAEKPVMTPVFNDDPNCFGFPYVYKFKVNADEISFGQLPDDLMTFKNTEKYNDFSAYYFEEKRSDRAYSAVYKKGGLHFDNDKFSEKGPLPTEGEDFEMIKAIANADIDPQEVYYNPFYGRYDENDNIKINHEYHYDDKKGAYINTLNYKEGEEYKKDDDAFNRMYIVYPFKALNELSRFKKIFTNDGKPVFNVTCK